MLALHTLNFNFFNYEFKNNLCKHQQENESPRLS